MMSLDQLGTFLQLGVYHSEHGIVLLSALEQFDGDRFYDPAYVRLYRTRLLNQVKENKPGFGLQILGESENATVITKSRRGLELSYNTREGVHVRRTISRADDGRVTQTTILSTTEATPVTVPVHFDLGMSLNRASYGQLTEGGPIPIPESLNLFQIAKDGSRFTVCNPNLGATVEGHFSTDCVEHLGLDFDDSNQVFRRQCIESKATTFIKVLRGVPVTLTLSILLRTDNPFSSPEIRTGKNTIRTPTWKLQDPAALSIIHGNLEYVLGNCVVPISETSTCVITDHVALPLGWNRDN
ncbi:hypothetical protein N7510_001620 [Penicillium lagena]|uniref:uncharacterized protein n=1 Tax=Penicillium lagena TaxID=94218 RepID=UPI0025406F43|nr:uncharacterized protein N7510_001620 [Penicillium lagena]KAJ5625311.1 hypothetical protein N7510_001620 [Penicillium lagena]